MKNNNWYNHVQSQKDNFNPIQRYLVDSSGDEAFLNSVFGGRSNTYTYSDYRARAVEKAKKRFDDISVKHIEALNNVFLPILEEFLPEGVLESVKTTQPLTQSLKNNPVLKKVLNDNPQILEQYNNILSSIDSPFKKQEERLQKLVKTDYGSAQHVEAFENSFLESLDLTEYFSYPDGSNGTVPDSIIECKEDIQDIAKELAEEIAPLYEAEIVLQEELEAQEVISEHSASPPSSEISSTHQESVLIKPSAFGGLIDIPEAQSEELGSSEANNQMSMAEMMARIQELEEANRAKDATIVKKDEQMQEMVTREEAEKMIAQKDADTISELKANRETINQLQKENAEQDRIIDSKDQKLDTAYMQVEMQKQMLDMKDQQIDGLVRDKDHLEIDKSELKVEVKELKEKLSKGNNDIDNKSYIKGLSEFDAMSDLSDLGKSKSDKGSVGKSSNSSVLRKKLETVEDENKPLKDMLAENFTNNELNSKLVPMIGENSNSNSDNEEKLDSIDFNDIDLT